MRQRATCFEFHSSKQPTNGAFYCVTAPGPHQGTFHLGFGTLDDPSGFDINVEYFIDRKPDAYALAGDREKLTAAEVFAKFGGG